MSRSLYTPKSGLLCFTLLWFALLCFALPASPSHSLYILAKAAGVNANYSPWHPPCFRYILLGRPESRDRVASPILESGLSTRAVSNNIYLYIYIYNKINHTIISWGPIRINPRCATLKNEVKTDIAGMCLAHSGVGCSQSQLPALCRQDTSFIWRYRRQMIHTRK